MSKPIGCSCKFIGNSWINLSKKNPWIKRAQNFPSLEMCPMFVLFIFLVEICPCLLIEYLCPVDAYTWYLFDNRTREIYQWIVDERSEEFNREKSLRGNENHYQLICADREQNFYRTIRIDEKEFDMNWICNYGMNEGQIEINSWIFNSRFVPNKLLFQIDKFFRMEISTNHSKKLIRISRNLIEQIVQNLSTIDHSPTIFYQLILDYGDKQGSIPVQLRPIFEQRYYLVPIDVNHRTDTNVEIDCSSS